MMDHKMMELIDTHCHLDLEDFDPDREDVIGRAREAGVVQMMTIGIDPATSARAVELARRHDFIFAAVGHHPHDAEKLDQAGLDRLRDLARDPKVRAFGEIGLDFFRNISPRQVQEDRFADLIELGLELGLPLIIHDRDAHEEVYRRLQAAGAGKNGGIIHCFSGDWSLARRFLDLGFMISVPGTITFPKAEALRDVVRKIPLEGLLLETDAPFLAPVPRRGRRNEPALVRYTALEAARIRNMPVEELAAATTANARRIFRLEAAS
ncbi:MAG: TatD family hydrolase [Pseudomonadota bacterium]